MRAVVIGLILLCSLSSQASYKSEIPGATQSEREIRWLWTYLNDVLISCHQSTTECQDPKIKETVGQLLGYVPQAGNSGAWMKLLQFVSEKDHPELFQTTEIEAHRVASTGLKKNSTVYINTDRMDLPLETWIGFLAHEVVHHLGVLDGADRYPDQVGAEISRHFIRQIQKSSFEQFHLPVTHTLVFNSAAKDRGSVSFLSIADVTSDIGWESNTQSVCKPSEKIASQFVSAPAWRLNRIQPRPALVTFRGGGHVDTVCADIASGARRSVVLPVDASITLQYPIPFDSAHWISQTPAGIKSGDDAFGPSFNENDAMFGQMQTFVIQSIQNQSPALEAGSTWNVEIKLKAIDGFPASTCQLAIAGTQYSYIGQDHLPGINFFNSCKIKNLGGGNWQITGSTVIPASARPDQYYISAILFGRDSNDDQRSAVPSLPTFVNVTNRAARGAPSIKGIQVLGLEPATSLGTLPLTNSYKTFQGLSFMVEMTVEGQVRASEPWLDVDLWFPMATEFGIAKGTGSSESWPAVLVNTMIIPQATGTKIQFLFVMPDTLSGLKIAAIKFRRFYFRTDDFSWVEISMPDLHDHMVINADFGR